MATGTWVDDDELALALSRRLRPEPALALPRLPLAELLHGHHAGPALQRLLAQHGFVVLTDVDLAFRNAWLELDHALHAFFTQPLASKAAATGGVVFDEHDLPLWHVGFDQSSDGTREAFRVPADRDRVAGLHWPSARFAQLWGHLAQASRRVCDRALALVCEEHGLPAVGADLSVAHAWHYPNDEGGGRTLDPRECRGEQGLTVKPHVDQSLFVLEPCPYVPGLEVQDLHSKR